MRKVSSYQVAALKLTLHHALLGHRRRLSSARMGPVDRPALRLQPSHLFPLLHTPHKARQRALPRLQRPARGQRHHLERSASGPGSHRAGTESQGVEGVTPTRRRRSRRGGEGGMISEPCRFLYLYSHRRFSSRSLRLPSRCPQDRENALYLCIYKGLPSPRSLLCDLRRCEEGRDQNSKPSARKLSGSVPGFARSARSVRSYRRRHRQLTAQSKRREGAHHAKESTT